MRYHIIIQAPYLKPQVVAEAENEGLAMSMYIVRLDHWGRQNGVVYLKDTQRGVKQPILAESRPFQ